MTQTSTLRVLRRDEDITPDLFALLAARTPPTLPADPVWILRELVTGPEKLIVGEGAGGPGLVGAVVDGCENGLDSAELLILTALPPDWNTEQSARMVGLAEDVAAAGPRSALEVALTPEIASFRDSLTARGFDHAFTTIEMFAERPRLQGASVPAGLTWLDLSPELVEAYFHTVRNTFAAAPGVSIPTFDVFASRALEHQPPVRLLMERDRIAGFARVQKVEDQTGRVEMIGRTPDRKGEGLGQVILDEALRVLAGLGLNRVDLQTAVTNRDAIRLYEAAGFAVTSSTETLIKRLA